MRHHLTPIRKVSIKKEYIQKNWGRCGEQEPLYIVGKKTATVENSMAVSKKTKNRTTI